MTKKDRPAGALPRQLGVDLARGVAVLFMIETHALDGWVAAPEKAEAAYKWSRVVSNIPAPLFLLLAGVALALGAAARPGTTPRRAKFMRRGAEVLGYGYLVSAVYALIEGRLEPAA